MKRISISCIFLFLIIIGGNAFAGGTPCSDYPPQKDLKAGKKSSNLTKPRSGRTPGQDRRIANTERKKYHQVLADDLRLVSADEPSSVSKNESPVVSPNKTFEVSTDRTSEYSHDEFSISKSPWLFNPIIETPPLDSFPRYRIQQIELPKNIINEEMNKKIQMLEASFLRGEMSAEKFVVKRKEIMKRYGVYTDY